MLAGRLSRHDDTPRDDAIVILEGIAWPDYQRIAQSRGDGSVPRLAYLEGALELMTPSIDHESIGARVGRLVEVWCLEHDVEFSAFGSWTITKKSAARAAEPDECYSFGEIPNRKRPDLAIEVIWTSGRLDKLEIYRKLGVPEVWIWRRGRISVHILRGASYVESPRSLLLPGLDIARLLLFLDRPTDSQAIRAYRAAIRAPK